MTSFMSGCRTPGVHHCGVRQRQLFDIETWCSCWVWWHLMAIPNKIDKMVLVQKKTMSLSLQSYRNDPKLSDRQVWAKSTDLDQNCRIKVCSFSIRWAYFGHILYDKRFLCEMFSTGSCICKHTFIHWSIGICNYYPFTCISSCFFAIYYPVQW